MGNGRIWQSRIKNNSCDRRFCTTYRRTGGFNYQPQMGNRRWWLVSLILKKMYLLLDNNVCNCYFYDIIEKILDHYLFFFMVEFLVDYNSRPIWIVSLNCGAKFCILCENWFPPLFSKVRDGVGLRLFYFFCALFNRDEF